MRKKTPPPPTFSPDLLALRAQTQAARQGQDDGKVTAVSSSPAPPTACPELAEEAVSAGHEVEARLNPNSSETAVSAGHRVAADLPSNSPNTAVSGLPALLAALPPHLGWDGTAPSTCPTPLGRSGQANSRHLRSAAPVDGETAPSASAGQAVSGASAPSAITRTSQPASGSSEIPNPQSEIFLLHPALALAFLREGLTAVARLWLLLRLLDRNGRGWWTRADIEATFTTRDAPTYLCTPRYLR